MSEGRTAVAILGGGIAGLTVALHLQRQAAHIVEWVCLT